MASARIRRQVYELTAADLERFPVWEFALDEEDEDDQDEATVRPYGGSLPLDPSDGLFIVRASMTLSDGTRLSGYLTPPVNGESGLDSLHPAVVAPDGQVLFWCGMLEPPSEHIAKNYRLLGSKSLDDVFPVRFESDIALVGGPVAGEIPGFVVLEDLETMRTKVVT